MNDIKSTTALNKIAGLKKKIRGIQGGQGAGKTYAILLLIINHLARVSNKECYIISYELTKMRDTVVKDCIKILETFGIPCTVTGQHSGQAKIVFSNNSFIRFLGLDKDDVGKGLRSDIVFVNEANKVGFEAYQQATSRAKNVFIDFNPDATFWFHEHIEKRPDCNFLKLTFLDNEYLSKEEREEILYYHAQAYGCDFDINNYNSEGLKVISKYWLNKWEVFGLGNVGQIDGAVFEKWEQKEVPKDARLLYYGCDFGFATSKSAVLAIYNHDNSFYIKQLVYKTQLTNQMLADEMRLNGYTGGVVYCDYAEPKSIRELQIAGVTAVKCDSKQDIKNFAIQKLNSKVFFVDPESKDLINELRYYVYDQKTNKPKKSELDHLMDALLYAIGSGDKYSGQYK